LACAYAVQNGKEYVNNNENHNSSNNLAWEVKRTVKQGISVIPSYKL
jgi:hypothetical protein